MLAHSKIHDADLGGCDLTDTDLSECDLAGARLTDAVLINTDLGGADLRTARGLTKDQLHRIHRNPATSLPPELD